MVTSQRSGSGDAGRQPVPVHAFWKKSSLSMSNGSCVEVARLPGGHVGIRDSKDGTGPVLRFTSDEWDAFVGGVRTGGFDGI
jgi:Domain of unknown function (DUF397)